MSVLESLGGSFDPDKLKQELEHLDKSLQDPENWKNHSKLNALNKEKTTLEQKLDCLLYTSPSPRDRQKSRMPSSA